MHELDRRKILNAGFALFRCSEVELTIKMRTKKDMSWKTISKQKTKKAIRAVSKNLLEAPFIVQD